jgi:PAS domain S-box-containing protein
VRDTPNEDQLRLIAIVSSSDEAIIGKDLNGLITSWNHSAELIFGYTAEEAIGQSIHLIVPSDRIQQEDEMLERVRVGEGVDHYQTIRKTKDCRLLEIALTVSPKAADGTVIGASHIAQEVTLSNRVERDARHFAAIVASSDDAIIS